MHARFAVLDERFSRCVQHAGVLTERVQGVLNTRVAVLDARL
jgi:hypothetical protein